MRRRACHVLLALMTAAACAGSCRSPQVQWTENDGGATRWIDTPAGRLKTRVYTGATASSPPVLVLVLHGDLPEPPPSYQYEFADRIARTSTGVVAAGVLRPGYADPAGDRSAGDMGRAVADNYSPEVVDVVALAARELSRAHDARAILMVGHSGGGAIAANLLGRHPDLAHAAVLAACGCDPVKWRATRRAETGNPIFDGPTRSLLPLDLARDVRSQSIVRMVVGEEDEVTPPAYSRAYATALRQRGIDVSVDVVPDAGHNILFHARVMEAIAEVLMKL